VKQQAPVLAAIKVLVRRQSPRRGPCSQGTAASTRGNGGGHQEQRSITVNGMHQALKRVLECDKASLGGMPFMNIMERPTMA